MENLEANSVLCFISGDITFNEALVISGLKHGEFVQAIEIFNHRLGFNNTIECPSIKGCKLCKSDHLPLTREIRRARILGKGEIEV